MTTATQPPARDTDRVQHRARVRAQAAAIADSPAPRRDFRVGAEMRFRPATRRRIHAPQPRPRRLLRHGGRRGATIAFLVVQLVGLGALLLLPAFQVRSVSIDGGHLLTRAAVLDAAAVPNQSIFTIDGNGVRARLLRMPWIRSATVTTELPNVVRISIVEWSPTLRLHRAGHDTLLADSGAAIDAAAGRPDVVSHIPVLVDERTGNTGNPDPTLVQMLDATSGRFPAVFSSSVAAYEWRADGVMVIWTSTGWAAVLGHVDSSRQIAAVPDQLAALAALRGPLNFAAPNFGYVDLENLDAPAAGGTPGLPAQIKDALAMPVAPAADAAQAATAKPAAATPAPTSAAQQPAPAPAATPIVIYLQRPPQR